MPVGYGAAALPRGSETGLQGLDPPKSANGEDLGRSAVNTLLALLSGLDAAFSQVTLPTELIVRQSTAPPNRD